MIAVVDYGAGNVRSVMHALEYIGEKSLLTRDAGEILSADAVILPGVGAFGDAMEQLRASGAVQAMEEFIASGRPFLGICIGEQLLFESSEETLGAKGLCWLRGQVKRIPSGQGRKIPHMGWNQLNIMKDDPLFSGLPEKPWMYFVHSYFVHALQRDQVLAQVDYGVPMDVAVHKGSLWAVQFHPEKSGETGLALLKNFASMK